MATTEEILVPAYERACRAINSVARDFNLIALDKTVLRGMEELASNNDRYAKDYVAGLRGKLEEFEKTINARVSSDLVSLYGEALVYWLFHDRLDIRPIHTGSSPTPDFRCKLSSGKEFFLEVKTPEYSGGEQRQRDLQMEALDKQIELEEKLKKGKPSAMGRRIAMAEHDITPLGNAKHGGVVLRHEIESLIQRLHGRFKSGQLAAGPTFAVVPVVRLSPATMRTFDALDLLAFHPEFHAPLVMGQPDKTYQAAAWTPVVPGRLWHIAFGKPATPLTQVPSFEGADRLHPDSYLDDCGLLVDGPRNLGAAGIIFLDSYNASIPFGPNIKGYSVLGLYDAGFQAKDWDDTVTEEVWNAIGAIYNDARDSRVAFYFPPTGSNPA